MRIFLACRLAQDCDFPIEIIVHDDASTDDSVDFIHSKLLKSLKYFYMLFRPVITGVFLNSLSHLLEVGATR